MYVSCRAYKNLYTITMDTNKYGIKPIDITQKVWSMAGKIISGYGALSIGLLSVSYKGFRNQDIKHNMSNHGFSVWFVIKSVFKVLLPAKLLSIGYWFVYSAERLTVANSVFFNLVSQQIVLLRRIVYPHYTSVSLKR